MMPAVCAPEEQVLDIEPLVNLRAIVTRAGEVIQIPRLGSEAAIEQLARFSTSPALLKYLPPLQVEVDEGNAPECLASIISMMRNEHVPAIHCRSIGQGSRAVIALCPSDDAASRHFSITAPGTTGSIWTPSGRAFFANAADESVLVSALGSAVASADLWDEFGDWVIFDGLIQPFSTEDRDTLADGEIPKRARRHEELTAALSALDRGAFDGIVPPEVVDRLRAKVNKGVEAINLARYAFNGRPRLAIRKVVASSSGIYLNQPVEWQHDLCARVLAHHTSVASASSNIFSLNNASAESDLIGWWETVRNNGGPGIEIAPTGRTSDAHLGAFDFVVSRKHGCANRPVAHNLNSLDRMKTQIQTSVLQRALGNEAIERFIGGESLQRIHECIFAVIALSAD